MAKQKVTEPTILEKIAAVLKKARTDQNLTIQQLKEKSGISHVTINNMETTKAKGIQISKLEKLCKALSLKIELLITPIPVAEVKN